MAAPDRQQGTIEHVDATGRMVVLTERNEALVIYPDQVRAGGKLFSTGMVVSLEREAGFRRMSDWRITG